MDKTLNLAVRMLEATGVPWSQLPDDARQGLLAWVDAFNRWQATQVKPVKVTATSEQVHAYADHARAAIAAAKGTRNL